MHIFLLKQGARKTIAMILDLIITSVVAAFDEVVGAREDVMYELEKLRIVGA
jgi:hypothetical protein